ncbi:MAG: DegV family protein [Anaerorhabdus sp.]
MIHLITDTSSLYSPSEAEEKGFKVIPLSVSIDGKNYQEFVDINADDFVELINKKNSFPTSSQPPVGVVIETIESISEEDEIIYLCMADGLSGTYQSALSAVSQLSLKRQKKTHVINSKTLCGPHRHLVNLILKWIKQGKEITDILKLLNEKIETSTSFLLPSDFGFLKRGGRCTPLAATIGGVLKLQPVVTQTSDGRRLDKFVMGRSFEIAVNKVINKIKESNLAQKKIYISHAFSLEKAKVIKEKLIAISPNFNIDILELSCAFITQGGPGCLAIQTIDE